MKGLQVGAYLVGAVLVGTAGAMALTNPDQGQYNQYATRRLTVYLKENACTRASGTFGNFLQEQCGVLLERNQNAIRQLVANNTTRKNFFLFSMYQTDLTIPELASVIPSYRVESVGAFQTFYIYKAEKR